MDLSAIRLWIGAIRFTLYCFLVTTSDTIKRFGLVASAIAREDSTMICTNPLLNFALVVKKTLALIILSYTR